MVAALIVIAVLGFGLPVAFWGISRWRESRPETMGSRDRYGEIDQWLNSEYQLSAADRTRVRQEVLGRQYSGQGALEPMPAKPASLEPRLLEPARGLAARVLGDEFPTLRRSRRSGWIMLGSSAVCLVGAVLVLAGIVGVRSQGPIFVLDGGLAGAVGVSSAIVGPRRARRNAERLLRTPGREPVTG